MALKTAWHRNRDIPWSANDVYDIDAMALAVPYCDVVVTEKACHHALVSTGVDVRMNTVLLRDLPSLVSTLTDWKASSTKGGRLARYEATGAFCRRAVRRPVDARSRPAHAIRRPDIVSDCVRPDRMVSHDHRGRLSACWRRRSRTQAGT